MFTINEAEIKEAVEQFHAEIKLPNLVAPAEITEILTLSRQDIKVRSTEDLALDMIQLAQYALYIKMQSNKLNAVMVWCDANISSILGRELPNTNGYGFIEKSSIIKRNDPQANKLTRIKAYIEVKLQSIQDLDRKLEFISQLIRSVLYSRKASDNGS